MVSETKGTTKELALRPQEFAKIKCGQAHFNAIDVDYAWVSNAGQV
jgi:restriction endonuclease